MAAEVRSRRAVSGPTVEGIFFFLLLVQSAAGRVSYSGDEEVEPGRPFRIRCEMADDGEEPYWTRDDHDLRDEDEYVTVEDRRGEKTVAEVSVRSAQKKHAGKYRCHPFSRHFHLLRVRDDRATEESKKFEYLLAVNQTLELFCDLGEKTDRVRVRWYKDEKRIEDGRVKIEDKRLTVENADQGDGGEYSCEVESDEDRQKVTYVGKVFPVYSAPGIRPFPPTLSFLNGSDLVLECHVFGGYPEPKIKWLVGNEAAERRPDYDDRLLVMPGGPGPNAVLYVDRVDYSDRNRYTCVAENAVGRAEASVWVTVRDNMIKTNEEEAGKGLTLLPGKELVLQCETTVCVNCTVEWLKDGEHLNKSDERIRIYDTNNSLIISPARVLDTGDYMCFINKSIIGEFINATIIVRPKTQVEQFDKSINLVQGNKLNLHCNVKVGIPVPTISWYKDGQLLNGSDDHIGFSEDDKGIPNAILTIDELEFTDRANYMCEADNGISSSNATTLVRVKDKLAALWPFLGICAEVIILCTIIFIYEKRKVKEVTNTDVDQIAESRNVPERGRSQEIRQRK